MIDLTNQEIFQAMQAEGDDVLLSDDGRRAFVFVRNMALAMTAPENKSLSNNPEIMSSYRNLIDRMSFVALTSLKDPEAVSLFKDKILTGLQLEGLNLVNKVKARLLAVPAFAERDNTRKQLRDALSANEESLGTGQIIIAGVKTAPTIGNWLKKYNARFGMVAVNAVARNQFLVSDPDTQLLDAANKQILRRLLELYDYLKLSSQTPEGLEDPVLFAFGDQRKVLRSGEFEDIVLPPQIEKILDEIFKIYQAEQAGSASGAAPAGIPARSLAYDKTLAAARTILQETQGDVKKLLDRLNDSLLRSAAEETAAGLLLLAQLRKLDDVLAEDERFRALVVEDLKKTGQDDKVEGFRLNPTGPNFLARFLKVVLEKKLGLAASDALAFGERLGRMLAVEGEKYSRIVVRSEKGNLKWNL